MHIPRSFREQYLSGLCRGVAAGELEAVVDSEEAIEEAVVHGVERASGIGEGGVGMVAAEALVVGELAGVELAEQLGQVVVRRSELVLALDELVGGDAELREHRLEDGADGGRGGIAEVEDAQAGRGVCDVDHLSCDMIDGDEIDGEFGVGQEADGMVASLQPRTDGAVDCDTAHQPVDADVGAAAGEGGVVADNGRGAEDACGKRCVQHDPFRCDLAGFVELTGHGVGDGPFRNVALAAAGDVGGGDVVERVGTELSGQGDGATSAGGVGGEQSSPVRLAEADQCADVPEDAGARGLEVCRVDSEAGLGEIGRDRCRQAQSPVGGGCLGVVGVGCLGQCGRQAVGGPALAEPDQADDVIVEAGCQFEYQGGADEASGAGDDVSASRDRAARTALWPPKPREELIANSMVCLRASPATRSRSMPMSGWCRLAVGGTIWCVMASTVSTASTAPAAPSR